MAFLVLLFLARYLWQFPFPKSLDLLTIWPKKVSFLDIMDSMRLLSVSAFYYAYVNANLTDYSYNTARVWTLWVPSSWWDYSRAKADDVGLVGNQRRDADCNCGRLERVGAVHCLPISHLQLLRRLQLTSSSSSSSETDRNSASVSALAPKQTSVVFRRSFGFGRRQITNFRPTFGFGRMSMRLLVICHKTRT